MILYIRWCFRAYNFDRKRKIVKFDKIKAHLLNRCKDTDFVEGILLLFLRQFAHFYLVNEKIEKLDNLSNGLSPTPTSWIQNWEVSRN